MVVNQVESTSLFKSSGFSDVNLHPYNPGNLLATPDGRLAFLDFGMMSEAPESARYAIISHVVHLVNRDYEAMVSRPGGGARLLTLVPGLSVSSTFL